jgi:hypothetical protein
LFEHQPIAKHERRPPPHTPPARNFTETRAPSPPVVYPSNPASPQQQDMPENVGHHAVSPGACLGEDHEELPATAIHVDHLKTTREFISALEKANVSSTGLDEEMIERLIGSPQHELQIDDADILFSLELFLSLNTLPQKAYHDARKAVMKRHSEHPVLSWE